MRVAWIPNNEEIPSVISGLDALLPEAVRALGERARAGETVAHLPLSAEGKRMYSLRSEFYMLSRMGYQETRLFWEGEDSPKEPLAKLLRQGDVEPVGERLERPYTIYGRVIHGRQVGRAKLGIPTANLRITGRLLPEGGVYLSRVWLGDRAFLGVTNLGQNPTVGETGFLSVETHILNFEGNLYGKLLEVGFIRRLRREQRFSGFDELSRVIHGDMETARKMGKDLPAFVCRRERTVLLEHMDQ